MSLDKVIDAAVESITATVKEAATSLEETAKNAASSIEERARTALQAVVVAAMTCAKTGLFSGLAYDRTVRELLADLTIKYVFVAGDLNGLKAINAKYNLHGGDMALKHAGALLKQIASECRAHAYHPSGDEFVVLVPPDALSIFIALATERFSQAVCMLNELEIPVRMSFGYAMPGDDEELQSVAARAEQALVFAKRVDGSTVEWTAEVAARSPVNERKHCEVCHTKFDCLIPRDAYRAQRCCPNCHEPVT
jgi:GGDEF domain-containing protein